VVSSQAARETRQQLDHESPGLARGPVTGRQGITFGVTHAGAGRLRGRFGGPQTGAVAEEVGDERGDTADLTVSVELRVTRRKGGLLPGQFVGGEGVQQAGECRTYTSNHGAPPGYRHAQPPFKSYPIGIWLVTTGRPASRYSLTLVVNRKPPVRSTLCGRLPSRQLPAPERLGRGVA